MELEKDTGALLQYHTDEYNRLRQSIREKSALGMDVKQMEGAAKVHLNMMNKLRPQIRETDNYKHLKR